MAKVLNLNTFLLILLMATSFIATSITGCSSSNGGGNNKTTIRGVVEEVIGGSGDVSDIRVSIFENNNRRVSDRTNKLANSSSPINQTKILQELNLKVTISHYQDP